ncbi:MAG: glycosyltransferase [Candidatus Cloacimonetes bacterium]|nr:glycosyltransferase [Candidatus Cloacimonadota bacterium]
MKKILYVDVPFIGISDGGANRSKFIWNTLINHYEVDWLELQREGIAAATGLPSGMNDHFTLHTETDSRFYKPIMIYRFRSEAKQKFIEIIKTNKYDIIFLRFSSPAALGKLAEPYCPALVFDVDMILSRLSQLSWQQSRVFKNRYYLLEGLKQRWFERKFFRKKYLFLFTNYLEKEMVQKKIGQENAENFQVLPNVMNPQKVCVNTKEDRVLFFGTLTSSANANALQFISEDIYPLICEELKKRDLYLDIAGKGWHEHFSSYFYGKQRLRYVGEVADIQQELSDSLFIFLPLRVASGTRTRILEVANQYRAVLTTSIGMEGLELREQEIVIENSAKELAREFINLLDNPLRRLSLGQKLHFKCRELYLDSNVSRSLKEMLDKKAWLK